jgi:hypothetical protein
MIIDAQNLLSDAQALTVTARSTNVIDLGVDRDLGKGEPMAVVVNVDVAADGTTGDETYQFDVETDDNVGFASPEVLVRRIAGALPNIPRAALIAGFRLVLPIPSDGRADRFISVNYTLGGTTPTITVTTHLQPMSMIQAEATYPDNITIS